MDQGFISQFALHWSDDGEESCCGSVSAMIIWGISETMLEKHNVIFIIVFGKKKKSFVLNRQCFSSLVDCVEEAYAVENLNTSFSTSHKSA